MITFYENRTDDFYCRDRRNIPSSLHCAAHLHPHLELILLLEKRLEIFADAERVVLEEGDLFVIFPNQIHRLDDTEKVRHLCFIINPDIMPELATVFAESLPASGCICGAGKDPEILSLALQLADLRMEKGPFAETRRRGYLLALFGRLLPAMDLNKTVPGDSHALKAIVNYCAKNYTKDLSLALLESELHISRYYISHLFSDKLRIGFNDYVNSLRVSFACNYLKHSDKSVTEISDLVGFGTLRTFNRAFQKQMGHSPSEYRRLHMAELSR